MSKIMTWLGIMSGVTLLMYYGGLIQNTVSATLLDLALNPHNFQAAPLWLKTVSLSTGLAVLASTFLARGQNSDFYLMVGVASVFFSFGFDFLHVYNQMAAYGAAAQGLAVLIFSPIIIMYVVSVFDWWRGIEA